MKGHIYVCSNKAYPGVVKIGRARRPKERARQLSSATGVLYNFNLDMAFKVPDCIKSELFVHEKLSYLRIKTNKEFFKITSKQAIVMLTEWFGPPCFVRKKFVKEVQNLKAKQESDKLLVEAKIIEAKKYRHTVLENYKKKIFITKSILVAVMLSMILCLIFF